MHNRQQIREQFGVLEEQLEGLRSLSRAGTSVEGELSLIDAIDSLKEISRLVHDQQVARSVAANDFLLRVSSLVVQEASTMGVGLALSHFGEGKISLEMAELATAALMAGLRASLRRLQAEAKADRVRKYLFPTCSLYIEVRATSSEIQFRVLDDAGKSDANPANLGRLREHVARYGGWFGQQALRPYGAMLEFKIPLVHNRAEALVLRQGNFTALVLSSCVAESLTGGRHPPEGTPVLQLDELDGLVPASGECAAYLRIGIADLQFWVGCEALAEPVRIRRVSAEGFVEPGCWMEAFGLFQGDEAVRVLPLLDGPALIKRRNAWEKET